MRATLLTQYIMNNDESAETSAHLSSIYGGTMDVFDFYRQIQHMVEDYLLGGYKKEVSLYDHILGYSDPRFQHIFDETGFFEGKDFLIDFVSPVFHELSDSYYKQVIGIYTGSVNMDRVSEMRYVNDKNYINKKVAILTGMISNSTVDLVVTPNN